MRNCLIIISIIASQSLYSQGYEIEPAKFNTNYAEYCAGLLNDAVIYSSNRKPEVLRTYLDEDDNYYTNLYLAKEKNGVAMNQDQVFSQEISTVLNDGSLTFMPDKKSFWYTSNIRDEDEKIKPGHEFKLGIFKAQKKDGKWVRTGAFPLNSKNQRYNVAHPAISPDGSYMVFSSDMDGGVGASDLWIIFNENGEWVNPRCLAEGINTEENELFPFIDKKGKLYFSSNGIQFGSGLDVFTTELFPDGNFLNPLRLKEPINTEFDDYAFLIRSDGESGYFSSNREGLQDDVYSFKYTYPDFVNCNEAYKPFMCYLIEETNIPEIDTLPLAYIWDFGDGTTANGFSHEHCFPDTGFYKISLNIIDTITGVTFASINDMELLIEQPNIPYITSKDTVIVGEEILFSSRESALKDFDVEEWFWEMGNKERLRGEEVYYKYAEAGTFYVQLGALSLPDENGTQSKLCAYKEVLVVASELELEILRELQEEEPLVLDYDYLTDDVIEADAVEEAISEEVIESTYYVEVTETEEPMALDDPFFERLNYEITERFQEDDSLYIYSVGQAKEVFALYDVYKEVLDSGYYSAIVKQQRVKLFKEEIESIGHFYPEEEREEWNRTITDFANIQFDNNSTRINDKSLGSLDYLAAMLDIEEEFKLSIDAYTDSKGNDEYNRSLSQRRADSVKEYFISKGIASNRLISNGHGEENPISSNETEQGRSNNRRVEFEILTVLFKNQIE